VADKLTASGLLSVVANIAVGMLMVIAGNLVILQRRCGSARREEVRATANARMQSDPAA